MIKYTTLVCPGAGAETSVYRLQLRLWLQPKVSAPAGSRSATLPLTVFNFSIASLIKQKSIGKLYFKKN
jgi:hypothetical protein